MRRNGRAFCSLWPAPPGSHSRASRLFKVRHKYYILTLFFIFKSKLFWMFFFVSLIVIYCFGLVLLGLVFDKKKVFLVCQNIEKYTGCMIWKKKNLWCFVLCNCSYLTGSTGAAGPRLFTIHQVDTCTDNLPKAHTWCVTLPLLLSSFLLSSFISCHSFLSLCNKYHI